MIIIGIIVLIALIGKIIEDVFSPRFDVTKENDLVLWYNISGKRTCVLLFKLK